MSESGIYSVTITDANGCEAVDSIFVEFVTGTSVVDGDINLALFPNPNTGTFTISGSISIIPALTLEIFTMQGTLVYKEDLPGLTGTFTRTISLIHGVSGMYLVRLNSGQKTFILRMVVN